MTTINLVPRRRILARAQRRRIVTWSIVVVVYSALIAIACIVMRLGSTRPDEHFETQMQEAALRLSTAADNARLCQAEIARLERQLDAAMVVGSHPDWSLLLAALHRTCADEVVLGSIEITRPKADPGVKPQAPPRAPRPGEKAKPPAEPAARRDSQAFSLKITGCARTPGRVFTFAHDLESLGPLDSVTISHTQNSQMGSLDVTAFELTALISGRDSAAASTQEAYR